MMARELLVVLVAEVDDWHSCGHVICYDCYVPDLVTLTEHYDHHSWYFVCYPHVKVHWSRVETWAFFPDCFHGISYLIIQY